MNETLLKTISELRTQLDDKVKEIKEDERMESVLKLYKTISTLEELAEVPVTSLGDVFGFSSSNVTVRPDEFYGLSPLEAAKRFIKKRERACTLDEIMKGLRSGGCHDFKEEELNTALSRSTLAIAKVGDDLYGLLEFYPHIKRGGKKKSTDKPAASESTVPESKDESTDDLKTEVA